MATGCTAPGPRAALSRAAKTASGSDGSTNASGKGGGTVRSTQDAAVAVVEGGHDEDLRRLRRARGGGGERSAHHHSPEAPPTLARRAWHHVETARGRGGWRKHRPNPAEENIVVSSSNLGHHGTAWGCQPLTLPLRHRVGRWACILLGSISTCYVKTARQFSLPASTMGCSAAGEYFTDFNTLLSAVR